MFRPQTFFYIMTKYVHGKNMQSISWHKTHSHWPQVIVHFYCFIVEPWCVCVCVCWPNFKMALLLFTCSLMLMTLIWLCASVWIWAWCDLVWQIALELGARREIHDLNMAKERESEQECFMKKKQHNLQKDVIIEWNRDKRHLCKS